MWPPKRTFLVGFKVVRHVLHLRLDERVEEQSSEQFGRPNGENQEEQLFVTHRRFLPV